MLFTSSTNLTTEKLLHNLKRPRSLFSRSSMRKKARKHYISAEKGQQKRGSLFYLQSKRKSDDRNDDNNEGSDDHGGNRTPSQIQISLRVSTQTSTAIATVTTTEGAITPAATSTTMSTMSFSTTGSQLSSLASDPTTNSPAVSFVSTSPTTMGLQISPSASGPITNSPTVSFVLTSSTTMTLYSPSATDNSTKSCSTCTESNTTTVHSLNVGAIVGTTIACIVVILGTITCFLVKRRLQRLRASKKLPCTPSIKTAPTISSFEPKEYRGSTFYLFPRAESVQSAGMRYTSPIPPVLPPPAWLLGGMSLKADRLAAVRSQVYDLPKRHRNSSYRNVSIATLSDSFSVMTGGINSVAPVEVDEWPRTASMSPAINSSNRTRRDAGCVSPYHDTTRQSRDPLSSKFQIQGWQAAPISQRIKPEPGSELKSGRASYRKFLPPVNALSIKDPS